MTLSSICKRKVACPTHNTDNLTSSLIGSFIFPSTFLGSVKVLAVFSTMSLNSTQLFKLITTNASKRKTICFLKIIFNLIIFKIQTEVITAFFAKIVIELKSKYSEQGIYSHLKYISILIYS